MVNYTPQSELRQLLYLLIVSLLFGLFIGQVSWTLVVVLTSYTVWNLRQLFRLHNWINNTKPVKPPASHGLWGAVFDTIYSLQRRHYKDQAKLEKVIKRFRASTYVLKDGFVMINKHDNIGWWNPAAERMLGLRNPVDINQKIFNLVRDPKFKNYFNSKNHETPLELPSPIKLNSVLEFQISIFGKHDHLMIVRDITQAKRAEKIRSDFIANVSHELRTPLTVIDGYVETLSTKSEFTQDPIKKAFQHMAQQCQRMKVLIEDLIFLSRLETKTTYVKNAVDIEVLAKRVINDLKPIIDEHENKLTLSVDSQHLVLGQEEDIYSLLSNLVSNASKYSQHASPIFLAWHANKTGGVLSVRDTGPGIDSMDLPRLTERFYRADKTRSQTIGGTGLGLAIVKHILLNHDATLEIDSLPGKGSTFKCIFPAHRIQSKQQTKAG